MNGENQVQYTLGVIFGNLRKGSGDLQKYSEVFGPTLESSEVLVRSSGIFRVITLCLNQLDRPALCRASSREVRG